MREELVQVGSNFFNELKTVLAEQNANVLGAVGNVSKKVDSIDARLSTAEEDIRFIKYETPIERRQAGRIRRAVAKRVCELLEVPTKKSERTLEEQVKYEKYSWRLFGKCYSEIPNEGHMARSSYLDTPKSEYDATMRDIDVFVPSSGMTAFYAEVDRDALAKKIAKEQGYEP